MPFYVYILECADSTYYTGHTDDLDRRMAQHGDGMGSRYTAKRRPLRLLWATDCQTREEAWELERRLHGWSRAKKEALMRGDFEALPGLARSRSSHIETIEARALSLRQAQGERSGEDLLG
jgi:predicted GIY-YIG superfamily endonuclease